MRVAMDHDQRVERDLIGERSVPASAYWGIHTLRAVENFAVSGQRLSDAPDLVNALASVKQAAALANRQLGLLDQVRADAIIAAAKEIQSGGLADQFPIDLIQGGAGTSTNMNANEVIANRALEIMGFSRGDYHRLHPNVHVNLGQSTNDVYPTALRVALWLGVGRLSVAMAGLREAFTERSLAFADVLKMGRTQLQDAVPMTLGQEFRTYAVMLAEDESLLAHAQSLLCEINLGGTAIGTGILTHPDYAALACDHLADITQIGLRPAPDLVAATQDCGALVQLSSVLKRIAIKLSKTCNDLRLLASGPRAGLGEINLPPRQAGSSIMPGKVNPVIPELVNQIAFEVIGNDTAVSMAAEAGQLQLNAFEPLIYYSLHTSLSHLTKACTTLERNCVRGITANADHLHAAVENTIGIVTPLSAHIGYENATRIALEAHNSGKSVRALVLEAGLMSGAQLELLLSPEALTAPNRA